MTHIGIYRHSAHAALALAKAECLNFKLRLKDFTLLFVWFFQNCWLCAVTLIRCFNCFLIIISNLLKKYYLNVRHFFCAFFQKWILARSFNRPRNPVCLHWSRFRDTVYIFIHIYKKCSFKVIYIKKIIAVAFDL